MRSARWPSRLAPLSLGLALWTGLPELQWCSATWEQCWSHCEATVAASAPDAEASRCEVACDGSACDAAARDANSSAANARAANACEGPATCAVAGPIDRCAGSGGCGATEDPPPPGERAWCVGTYADGVPTRSFGIALPAAPSHPAVQIEAPAAAIAPERPIALPAVACPGIASAHAPPLARAPPARA